MIFFFLYLGLLLDHEGQVCRGLRQAVAGHVVTVPGEEAGSSGERCVGGGVEYPICAFEAVSTYCPIQQAFVCRSTRGDVDCGASRRTSKSSIRERKRRRCRTRWINCRCHKIAVAKHHNKYSINAYGTISTNKASVAKSQRRGRGRDKNRIVAEARRRTRIGLGRSSRKRLIVARREQT